MFSKLKYKLEDFHNHQFPRLKHKDGLLNDMVGGFGWFNLILGAALYTQAASTADFFIITDYFSYQFWGITFFIGGASLLLAQLFNRWRHMRITLLVLIFTKIIWLAALLGRQVSEPGSNVFLILFFGLALYFQSKMYLRFPVYDKVEIWKK